MSENVGNITILDYLYRHYIEMFIYKLYKGVSNGTFYRRFDTKVYQMGHFCSKKKIQKCIK
jgi:hypothetical protein